MSADTATCDDCLAELFDPADRRFRYPFVNCTNCGPRFTIVRGVPYDRPLTTMAGFEMCAACRRRVRRSARPPLSRAAERVPGVRAGGAAPGPRRRRPRAGARDAVAAAAQALRGGPIVAVKGVGGFHLACRADDERAVAALRARKHREDRPFALMARRPRGARARWWSSAPSEDALLTGRERPIVIAPRRAGARGRPVRRSALRASSG